MKFSASHFLLVIFILTILSCDLENSPPTISEQTFSVLENSTPGLVFAKINAFDYDGDRLRYSINEESVDFPFEVNKGNGELKIKSGAILDYEQRRQYKFQVKVSDGMLSSWAIVTINIINIPDK